MRIAIVGAGAIGCLLAGRLGARGHQITLVGRSEQVDAIGRDGLLLVDVQGRQHHCSPAATARLTERPELILLAVKTQDVAPACAALPPLAQGVPVVTLQNGLQADALAAGAVGRDAVVGAVMMCAASMLRPPEVHEQFAGWLLVGEPFGAVGPRTRAIAGVLGDALPTYLTRHLPRVRWSKLVANLNNALCAATGLTLPELARSPTGRRVSLRAMKEGWRVARAAGIRLDHGLYGLTPRALRQDRHAAAIALLQSALTPVLATLPEGAALALLGAASRSRLGRLPVRGSTWQSIVRGRPTEIDYLNGEIVRRGEQLGVPTPYNAHLVALVREVERSHAFCPVEALEPSPVAQPAPPSMSAEIP